MKHKAYALYEAKRTYWFILHAPLGALHCNQKNILGSNSEDIFLVAETGFEPAKALLRFPKFLCGLERRRNFDRCAIIALPSSATGGGRALCPGLHPSVAGLYNKKVPTLKWVLELVAETGFEPATSGLWELIFIVLWDFIKCRKVPQYLCFQHICVSWSCTKCKRQNAAVNAKWTPKLRAVF